MAREIESDRQRSGYQSILFVKGTQIAFFGIPDSGLNWSSGFGAFPSVG